jgi:hypothetical protein
MVNPPINDSQDIKPPDIVEPSAIEKEVYIQTQHWTRHNETLIVATNTVLLGALAAIGANYFKDINAFSHKVYIIPLLVSLAGIGLTIFLSRQYVLSVSRVVAYEKYFKLHTENKKFDCIAVKTRWWKSSWEKTFVPEYLEDFPTYGPITSWFFLLIHIAIATVSALKLYCL